MSAHRKLEKRQLLDEIKRLCLDEASGTVFIATADNHQAKLVLDEGEIIFISLQRLRGMEALNKLATQPTGVFGFNPELQIVTQNQTLPDTKTILEALSQETISSGPHKNRESPREAKNGIANSTVLQVLIKEATEYLGPMAMPICQDYLKGFPDFISQVDVQLLIRKLEADINDSEKANEFSVAARKRMGII